MSQFIQCDVAIIGGGAGGLSLASGAAQLGLSVVLVESNKMGGDCLNYGCVPSKALLAVAKSRHHCNVNAQKFGVDVKPIEFDFKKVMQQVHGVIEHLSEHDSIARFESLGVRVIQAKGQFVTGNELQAGTDTIQARRFVIATGSSPQIPPIPGLNKINYHTNETIFSLEKLPEHLIVIGAGPIGCELAQAFSMLGSKVSVIEAMTVLTKEDPDCRAVISHSMESMSIHLHEHSEVQGVQAVSDTVVRVEFKKQGQLETIEGSHLLVATGRQINVEGLELEKAQVEYSARAIKVNARLQTSNKKIYAVGDVVSPYQFTHMAGFHAGIVLRNIVFKMPAKINYQAVPWVTFTEPEISHVGLLAQDFVEREMKTTQWSYADNDRAQTEGATEGLIKVITTKKGKILGVTIAGSQAGELILPWVMAIREGKKLRSFTDAIVPYPTLSEVSKQVAGEFYKPLLFSNKTRRLVRWLQKLG